MLAGERPLGLAAQVSLACAKSPSPVSTHSALGIHPLCSRVVPAVLNAKPPTPVICMDNRRGPHAYSRVGSTAQRIPACDSACAAASSSNHTAGKAMLATRTRLCTRSNTQAREAQQPHSRHNTGKAGDACTVTCKPNGVTMAPDKARGACVERSFGPSPQREHARAPGSIV